MSKAFPTATLPPLEWLRVFDAAAARGNFTAAAEELGLTQAAVSQRIRNLEAHLGARLFRRRPRGVELTVDGEAYAPHVHNALAALQRGTADLFGKPKRKLTVAAPVSILDLWLMPRLGGLIEAFPALDVTFTTVHRHADIDVMNADFDVRFGGGDWPGRNARKLFDEALAPVAAPGRLDGGAVDWRQLPQIAVSGPRHGWRDWAAAAGVSPPRAPSIRFESLSQAVNAAVAGVGVMLGSLDLIGPYLASGALARPAEPAVRMESGYWLTWNASDPAYRDQPAIADALCAPASVDARATGIAQGSTNAF